jgi:hypothetical protein
VDDVEAAGAQRAREVRAHADGTPTRLRREIGTRGPRTTSSLSSSEPLRSACLPAARSAARFDEATIVTACPSDAQLLGDRRRRARSPRAAATTRRA